MYLLDNLALGKASQRLYYRSIETGDYSKIKNLKLREKDQEELIASTGKTPQEALIDSVFFSKYTWVVIIDKEIEGVFGVAEANQNGTLYGIPWFLATDKINFFSYKFAKESKRFTDKVLPLLYPTMCNLVCSTNEDSIKWLKWLGFIVDEDNPIILKDPEKPFYKFYQHYTKLRRY